MRMLRVALCVTLLASITSCWLVRTSAVETMSAEEAVGSVIRSPLKAFHVDGTISVFPEGGRVTEEGVFGAGLHYSLDQSTSTSVTSVPLDSIIGIEAFRRGFNPVASLLLSSVTAVGSLALFKAIFGSCPTIYTYENGEEVLHAEAFSYSIAPLLEARDVDRLGAGPDASGLLRLELRNEALETHYINHFEILEARHAPGRSAYPNEDGRIVSVGPASAPSLARDRDGGVRTEEIRDRDGLAFRSTDDRIAAVTSEDYRDHLELTFPRPESASAALVLRLRNSLLNSVLFYDMMLASQGAEALDWVGTEINRIGEAVELGRWFTETFGLRVSVLGPDGWQDVTRLGDTGPIAWKEVALTVPVLDDDADEVRIRLTFLADEWRIDYAGLAADPRRIDVLAHEARAVSPIDGEPVETLRRQLAEPDEAYMVTTAGTAAYVDFDVPDAGPEQERTFFLSTQGYYTEWMRPDWIRSGARSEGFEPSEDAVVELMRRWLLQKAEFEERFYQTRIPVR